MAEIHVERKRTGGRGPLLLGLLVLIVAAAAAWFLLGRGGDGADAPPPAAGDTAAAAMPAETIPEPILPPATGGVPAAEPGIVGDDTSGRTPPPADTPATP